VLRRWTEEDRLPLAAITADPEVMRFRLAPLSRDQSDRLIDETEESFEQTGLGLWVVERSDDRRLLGFAGFGRSDFDAPFCPAVDIGWTLARDAWGTATPQKPRQPRSTTPSTRLDSKRSWPTPHT